MAGTSGITELRDRIKIYIDHSKEEKRRLKERSDELKATLTTALENLSTVSTEYRELLDNQTEILESIHAELSSYKDAADSRAVDTEPVATPTQVETSESPGTSREPCFISNVNSTVSQPQNEKIQMKRIDHSQNSLHVQKVIYPKRRKTKNELTLRSSSSSSFDSLPNLPECTALEINQQLTPPATIDIQTQIIDDYCDDPKDDSHKKQFVYPYQLVNGPNNELIISNRDHHNLVVFDETLQSSCVYGQMGFDEGTFFFPTGLAVDTTESCLFVADHNNIIQRFAISYPNAGKFPCQFEYMGKYGSKGSEEGQLKCPCGLALSKKGLGLFVCDLQNHRIQIFAAKEGPEVTAFGKRGDRDGEFNEPHSIAINNNEDKLFVSDHGNHRIQVFNPQGDHELLQVIVDVTNAPNWPQLKYPRGIYCTQHSQLLVSCTHTNCVLVFKEDGTYLYTFEDVPQPGGIILHHTGNIIVTSTEKKSLIVLKSQKDDKVESHID